MCSRLNSPGKHQGYLSKYAQTEIDENQRCDEEVAEIMQSITNSLEECLCQKYAETDVSTGQRVKCTFCAEDSQYQNQCKKSNNTPCSAQETKESYIARRIEQTIQTLRATPLVNNLLGKMDTTFEPVPSVTDEPFGDPYKYPTPSAPVAVASRRRALKPKVIPPETFMKKYYHPYEKQDTSNKPSYPCDRQPYCNKASSNQPRPTCTSGNASYPYDTAKSSHPYRKYLKRPNTVSDNRSKVIPRDECFRTIESNSARSPSRNITPLLIRQRAAKGCYLEAEPDIGYDVDKKYFENKKQAAAENKPDMLSTGFEILCNVLRKMNI